MKLCDTILELEASRYLRSVDRPALLLLEESAEDFARRGYLNPTPAVWNSLLKQYSEVVH